MGDEAKKFETVPIDSIKQDPKNVRVHNERNIDAVMRSLRRFGQQHPIVVDKDGIIRAGNCRWEAAKKLGWTEIDIVHTDLEGLDAAAFAIADNRTAELGEWNMEDLGSILREIDVAEIPLEDIGFEREEIDHLLREMDFGPTSEEDQADLDDSDEQRTRKFTCPNCGYET